MGEVCHVIGNGDSARMYNTNNRQGIIMTCNLPPFGVPNAYATGIVDFKMMRAIQEESVIVPGDWVLGFRPKIHMEKNPSMRIKHAHQIREFYTVKPDYVPGYTEFSCGHMVTHYMCTKFRPSTLHMYGFDSLFNFDLGSASDMYMTSVRDHNNNMRLTTNWRGIWPNQFAEFPNIQFVLHGAHKDLKVKTPDNVEIFVH